MDLTFVFIVFHFDVHFLQVAFIDFLAMGAEEVHKQLPTYIQIKQICRTPDKRRSNFYSPFSSTQTTQ